MIQSGSLSTSCHKEKKNRKCTLLPKQENNQDYRGKKCFLKSKIQSSLAA